MARGWRNNPVFGSEYSRGDAWCWLIETACFKPTKFDINGHIVTLKRGQLCASVRQMAEAWGWSRMAVGRFLTRLKTETMIVTESGTGIVTGKSVITICNYDKYQGSTEEVGTDVGTRSGTTNGTTLGQLWDKKEEGKKERKIPDAEASGATALIDPVKAMFDAGIRLLASAGIAEPKARSLLGKWKRDYGEIAVMAALGKAQREGAIDPVSFIQGCFRAKEREYEPPRIPLC
jgi:hypothetical protein